MGRLSERLKPFPSIGLDTSIFIYHFEEHPAFLPLTRELLSGIETGQWEGITSTITLMELMVLPLKLERGGVARNYEALLVHFPHLRVVDIDRNVSRKAAQIRAGFGIRPPDALQVAASLVHGARVFATNDRGLVRLQSEIDIVILDDFVAQDG